MDKNYAAKFIAKNEKIKRKISSPVDRRRELLNQDASTYLRRGLTGPTLVAAPAAAGARREPTPLRHGWSSTGPFRAGRGWSFAGARVRRCLPMEDERRLWLCGSAARIACG